MGGLPRSGDLTGEGLGCGAYLLEGGRAGVDDRLPGDAPGKERGERDRYVGEHEEGEGQREGDLLPGGGVDAFPLAYRGAAADDDEREVGVEQHREKRLAHDRDVTPRGQAQHRRRAVCKHADEGQDSGGHDVHGHIKAGEAAVRDAREQVPAVFAENLQVAPRPAQALVPALAEAGGLLVVEDGLVTVAYLQPPDLKIGGV